MGWYTDVDSDIMLDRYRFDLSPIGYQILMDGGPCVLDDDQVYPYGR